MRSIPDDSNHRGQDAACGDGEKSEAFDISAKHERAKQFRVSEAVMPYTRRQVKYLLSEASPLSEQKKASIKAELHKNPKLGHARKGGKAMKRT